MSVLGAMNTAVSGLAAQSAAFSNISDNVANAQTVGFKGVNTSFEDYLTTSSALVNDPGTVVATPQYLNTVQGTITQSQNPLALAVSGQGFFAVSEATNAGSGSNVQTQFDSKQYYTRDGDFQLNAEGYLTNNSGLYLNGWIANPTTGVLDQSNIQPIQVAQTIYAPVATQNMTMSANLPSGYHLSLNATNQVVVMNSANTEVQAPTSQVEVYDSQGNVHQLTLTWMPTATSASQTNAPWTLSIADTTNGGNAPILGTTPTAAQTAAAAAATTQAVKDQAQLTKDQAALTSDQSTLSTNENSLLSVTNLQSDISSVQTAYDQMGKDQQALAATSSTSSTYATLQSAVATDLTVATAALGTLATDEASAVGSLSTAQQTQANTALKNMTTAWQNIYGSSAGTGDIYTVATDQLAVNTDTSTIESNTAPGGAAVSFGANGTLDQVSYTDPATGQVANIAATAVNPNPLAVLTIQTPYSTPTGTQSISLNLGNIGETNGVTNFAASSYTLSSLSQDGVPPGSFSSISTTTSGDIYANYNNGQTRLIAQVPLATFGNADALQSQNGSAYTVTNGSGNPSLQAAGTNGAGSLVTSSVESSNVDIASQFSQLIIAQQAYSANAKVVTTADQLMQTTINMKS